MALWYHRVSISCVFSIFLVLLLYSHICHKGTSPRDVLHCCVVLNDPSSWSPCCTLHIYTFWRRHAFKTVWTKLIWQNIFSKSFSYLFNLMISRSQLLSEAFWNLEYLLHWQKTTQTFTFSCPPPQKSRLVLLSSMFQCFWSCHYLAYFVTHLMDIGFT